MTNKNRGAPTAPPSARPPTTETTLADASALTQQRQQLLATQKIGAQHAATAVPYNPLKASEHGLAAGHAPLPGQPIAPHDRIDLASTHVEAALQRDLQLARESGVHSYPSLRLEHDGQTLVPITIDYLDHRSMLDAINACLHANH
mgnify:CR=1 FL=1